MVYNFLRGGRDQPFLLPPDPRDWLPKGHLAWFILDVVDQLDLAPFYRAHRDDGHVHPAYDPKTLLGLLLYGHCLGVRSSRQLERRCTEDNAFRVLAANQTPDHVTIARFRVRHEQALAGFLVESLKLCAAAGMVQVGTVALDGTKAAAAGQGPAGGRGRRAVAVGRRLRPLLDHRVGMAVANQSPIHGAILLPVGELLVLSPGGLDLGEQLLIGPPAGQVVAKQRPRSSLELVGVGTAWRRRPLLVRVAEPLVKRPEVSRDHSDEPQDAICHA